MNEIKKISREDYSNFFPSIAPISIGSENNEDEYCLCYSLYHNWLLNYLINELNLKKYDDMFLNSNSKFQTTKEEDMDIYQYLASSNLKYFYLRNNIHLENLTKEKLDILLNYSLNQDFTYNEEKKNFINSTYQKVIFEDIFGDNSVVDINYGPENRSFFAPNNAIVIGFRYDELYNYGMTDDEWDDLHDNQIDELVSIFNLFNEETKNKLIEPHQLIMYNDFSVKKKLTNNKIEKIR